MYETVKKPGKPKGTVVRGTQIQGHLPKVGGATSRGEMITRVSKTKDSNKVEENQHPPRIRATESDEGLSDSRPTERRA